MQTKFNLSFLKSKKNNKYFPHSASNGEDVKVVQHI